MLSQPPEIQYIALRNVHFLVEKQPLLLRNEIKHFFSSGDELHYIRTEKLDILTKLVTKKNADAILRELHEYGKDIDDDIARKAIKCIGQIASLVDVAADRTIKYLMDIVNAASQQMHIQHEAAISLSEILRKYPQKFGVASCVKTMVGKIKILSEGASRAAVIWMLGEYSEKLKDSVDVHEVFGEIADK